MKTYGLILSTILLAVSQSALSFEFNNSVGLTYNVGIIEVDNTPSTDELNDISTEHFKAFYEAYLSKHFALGVSYLQGDSSDFDGIIFDSFTNSSLEYDSFALEAKFLLPVRSSNAFYGAFKAHQYNYDIIDDGRVISEEDGTDFGFSIGWMYKWSFGLGLDVQFFELLEFGSDVRIRSGGFGVSYSF